MTAIYMFGSHPDKDKIEFKVLPLIHEILHSTNDVHVPYSQLRREFEDSPISFDWSYVEQLKYPDAWAIEVMANQEKKQKLMEIREREGKDGSDIIYDEILRLLPIYLETYSDIF